VTVLFFWRKFFDDLLVTSPGAVDAAFGMFFFGKKRPDPVPMLTVVDSYHGSLCKATSRVGA
jgi:hypothetical protein